MYDLTPLPNPSCGAVSPDGDLCPSDSAVIIASEWPTTGYATAIWRCPEHIGASVEAAIRLSPQSVVTVTPLAAIENTADDNTHGTAEDAEEPSPGASAGDRPSLRLVR